MKLKDIIRYKLGSCFLDDIEQHASDHIRDELNKQYKLVKQ